MMKNFARAALLPLLAILLAGVALAAKTVITVKETPCGICTEFATEADWTAAAGGAFQWQTVPALRIDTGASGSRNDRALVLTTAGSPTLGVSCSPTLSAGFSLGVNGLQWSSASAYSGVCRYTATIGALIARSKAFTVEAIVPPSSDATPATVPRELSATSGMAGQVPLSWDASADPYVGEPGTGVVSYDLLVNGGTLITGIPAAIGLSQPLTLQNIGVAPGTQSCSQSGSNWTVVGTGVGQEGAADGIAACLTQVTGPVCATATITSVTQLATYNKGFLELRSTNDLGSIAYSYNVMNIGGSYTANIRARTATGGNRGSLSNEALTSLPVTFRACKAADSTITFSRSYDGNTFTTQYSRAASGVTDTAFVGIGATATDATKLATVQFQQVSINNAPRVTYTHLNTSGAATTYQVRSRDGNVNLSSYGPTVTATPAAPTDLISPTRTAQPSLNANGSPSQINANLGDCSDNVAIGGFTASFFAGTSCGGTPITILPQQTSNLATFTGLTASSPYSLSSQCFDTAGNPAAAISNCVTTNTAASASDPTVAPSGVTVTPIGTSSPTTMLRVSWSPATNAHHYRVRYKLTSASAYTLLPGSISGLTVDIAGLASDTLYDVQVASANASETVLPGFESGGAVYQGRTQSISTSAIRSNFGHYVDFESILYMDGNLSFKKSQVLALLDAIADEPNVLGVQVAVEWALLECATAGVYSCVQNVAGTNQNIGFALVDEIVARAQLRNKKILLSALNYQIGYFGGGVGSFPAYLFTADYGEVQAISSSVAWRRGGVVGVPGGVDANLGTNGQMASALWETATMNRLIALSQAYGARYKDNSIIEIWSPLTNLAFPGVYNQFGYSSGASSTQMRRLIPAARAAWPNTTLRLWIDYFGTDNDTKDVIDAAVAADWAVGGNDVLPLEDVKADRVFNGELFGTDYRGVVPWVSQAALPELCGKDGTFTPTQLFNHALDGDPTHTRPGNTDGIRAQRPQYFVWYRNLSFCDVGGPQRWDSGATGAYSTSSTSSVSIGTGTKTFTVASGLSFASGQYILIVNDANNYMEATITSYSGTTLTVNVLRVVGSGTKAIWGIRREGTLNFIRALGGAVTNGLNSIRISPAAAKAACMSGYAGGCQ